MANDQQRDLRGRGPVPQSSVLSPQSSSVVRVTQHATLERVLDQLRDGPPGSVTLLLDPLSVLFATPDHFRALDAVRVARRLAVTIEVADAHRTGLALAFGYRVRQPGNYPEEGTAPVPDIHYGPPNRTGAMHGQQAAGSGRRAVEDGIASRISPRTPNSELPTARSFPRRGFWIGVLILCFALGGVGSGAAVVGRVHTADVTVRPVEQPFSRVVQFAVSVTPTNDPNALQTKTFEKTIAREGDATATGKSTVPDGTASGVMTFRSRADGATTLKSGTTLKGPRDVSYVLQSDTVVPGLDFGRGQLGEASGKVRASQPGPAGNLASGFSARYTDNVTYISGEITGGTEKEVSVVSDDDIAALRARLEADLRMHALAEVNAALPSGATALNDYLTLRTPTVTAQPSAGTQADSVHVRVAITAQVPVYQNTDFDALIDRRLTEAVREAGATAGGAQEVLPETVTRSKPVFVDVQGSLVRYFATVTGTTRATITDADLARLRAALVGRDGHAAEQVLSGERALSGYSIRYGPSWLPGALRDRMPRTLSHIHVQVGVQG
jgi:baseplate J-like protein